LRDLPILFRGEGPQGSRPPTQVSPRILTEGGLHPPAPGVSTNNEVAHAKCAEGELEGGPNGWILGVHLVAHIPVEKETPGAPSSDLI